MELIPPRSQDLRNTGLIALTLHTRCYFPPAKPITSQDDHSLIKRVCNTVDVLFVVFVVFVISGWWLILKLYFEVFTVLFSVNEAEPVMCKLMRRVDALSFSEP